MLPPLDPRQQARQTAQRDPASPMAWLLLADIELDGGHVAEGEAACRRALALIPGHPEALARLGRVQWMQGNLDAASETLRTAAARAPEHPGIALWLGHVAEDLGQAEEALLAYRHAHAMAPQQPQLAAHLLAWQRKLCDWRNLHALSQQVRTAVQQHAAVIEPFAFLSEDGSAAEQLQCARLRASSIAHRVRPLPTGSAANATTALKLGFLSNGFGAHPTGLLTVALFEALQHRHGELALHLFALTPDDGSQIRQRLQAATQVHEMHGMADAAIAQHIRDTGIDVLFDLRGWGGGGRPEVLAMRPAPVQVNWLAYPGTSGAPWIDYVLADAFTLPTALEPHFSEKVVRLPRCFQPSDTRRAVPAPPARASCGLPEPDASGRGVVFCCFNNSYKLNPRSVLRALKVLLEVPGSVLWLLSGPGQADQRLRAYAASQGVDPQRLVFMPKQPHADYLARLQLADLFLDTGPYNAHTTASDALWVGCPVLTRPGDTFAARVAGSLNHHLGMASMNVDSDSAFIARAVELGHDRAKRQALRAQLALRRSDSGLFDMDGFARDFAATVRQLAAG